MATASERRIDLRDKLWPGSGDRVWCRKTNDGFATIPRLLPLVMHLIARLSKKGDPTATYMEIWARSFDEGVVTYSDEAAAAYASGYSGARAVRTWHERIDTLERLGFIAVKPSGNRKVGFILLINPLIVCCEMRYKEPDRVPDAWWTAFLARASEIGARLPIDEPEVAPVEAVGTTEELTPLQGV